MSAISTRSSEESLAERTMKQMVRGDTSSQAPVPAKLEGLREEARPLLQKRPTGSAGLSGRSKLQVGSTGDEPLCRVYSQHHQNKAGLILK